MPGESVCACGLHVCIVCICVSKDLFYMLAVKI